MVRRSTHTADQLRELILHAATELIESNGLAGLSAREIAKRINYSPGTIYNVFEGLDDLILRIEGRLLDRLDDHLESTPATADRQDRVLLMANAYLEFTRQNPKLWNLLLQHQMANTKPTPDWYQQKIDQLQNRFETALTALPDKSSQPKTTKACAQALFYALHGITALATSEKMSNLPSDTVNAIVQNLVKKYTASLSGANFESQRNTI